MWIHILLCNTFNGGKIVKTMTKDLDKTLLFHTFISINACDILTSIPRAPSKTSLVYK